MPQEVEDKDYDTVLSNVRQVVKTRQGKELIWEILSRCGIYTTMSGAKKQSIYFNEGQRSIGLQIVELLNEADPEIYPNLLKEHIKNG